MDENLVMTEFKESFGEINTPFSLIKEMLSLFPEDFLFNKNNKWLDPGCGQGNISWILYQTLLSKIHDTDFILNKMLFMLELNEKREKDIREKFNNKQINYISTNYIFYEPKHKYNAIICNPPFNFGGNIKTPTNNNQNKKEDGFNSWCDFINKSIEILEDDGYMCFIVPALWLKPDKAGIYHKLLKYKIHYIKGLSATETNTLFNKQAQTPTTIFLLQKTLVKENILSLFCSQERKYVTFKLKKNKPIPMTNINLLNKMNNLVNLYGHIDVVKTNMPPKSCNFSLTQNKDYPYKCIRTVTLIKKYNNNDNSLNFFNSMEKVGERKIEWCDEMCDGYGIPKIILAHKMFGMPFLDISGEYGISNRDNYYIFNYTIDELLLIYKFLSHPSTIKIYDTTRYRMRYLEKYAFEYIPDITKIPDIYSNLNNDKIEKFFYF